MEGVHQAVGEPTEFGESRGDGLAGGLVGEAEAEALDDGGQGGKQGGGQQEQIDGDEPAVALPG